jgi:hypothetical protein
MGYMVSAAIVSASGYTLTAFGGVIACAVSATIGWIFGGIYARSQITSGIHTSVYIPLVSSRTWNF